jgi:hypothetical protein
VSTFVSVLRRLVERTPETTLADLGHPPGGRPAFSMRRREKHADGIDQHFQCLLAFLVNRFSAFA